MKILLLDIETSPNTAYVWGLNKQHLQLHNLIDSSYTLCWAAKWLGDDKVMFASMRDDVKTMLKTIHKLLDEADVVVHYYGTKFDIPTLNKEFIINGMLPPAPFKQIDLLKVARNRFKFASNKLSYVAEALGLGAKIETKFDLWVRCMNNESKAWKEMEAYNKHDVVLLERVYEKFKPWIKNHTNYNLYVEEGLVCTNCGSTSFQRRGYAYTSAYKYQRYQCRDCGTWFRGCNNLGPNAKQKFVTIE